MLPLVATRRGAAALGATGVRLAGAARSLYTKGERDLETPEDWMDFQRDRHDRRTLIELMSHFGSDQHADNTWTMRTHLHQPPADTTMSALIAAGAHFGHATQIMSPNFMPYAYGERAGITIIDMEHTLPLLRRAAQLTRSVAQAGGQIVFVGTRPDLRPIVEKAAARIGSRSYHVGERWLPGTLTNKFQMYGEDVVKAVKIIPDLVIILNPLANMNAIRECAVEHVPTIGIIDSNADPRLVMYAIPSNDESTRAAELIAGVLSMAARAGVEARGAEFEDAQYLTMEDEEEGDDEEYEDDDEEYEDGDEEYEEGEEEEGEDEDLYDEEAKR